MAAFPAKMKKNSFFSSTEAGMLLKTRKGEFLAPYHSYILLK
jgi:hypothetical protein